GADGRRLAGQGLGGDGLDRQRIAAWQAGRRREGEAVQLPRQQSVVADRNQCAGRERGPRRQAADFHVKHVVGVGARQAGVDRERDLRGVVAGGRADRQVRRLGGGRDGDGHGGGVGSQAAGVADLVTERVVAVEVGGGRVLDLPGRRIDGRRAVLRG